MPNQAFSEEALVRLVVKLTPALGNVPPQVFEAGGQGLGLAGALLVEAAVYLGHLTKI